MRSGEEGRGVERGGGGRGGEERGGEGRGGGGGAGRHEKAGLLVLGPWTSMGRHETVRPALAQQASTR